MKILSFWLLFPLLSSGLAACTVSEKVQDNPDVLKGNKRFAVGSEKPRKEIETKGVTLAYHDNTLNAHAIVCLHAIGHGGRDFDEFKKAFGDRYRILTLDWPGQGYSGQDQKPAGIARYTELLETWVDQLGLQSFVILGNSIGGGVAISYAAKHPDKVRGLILADPSGLDKRGLISSPYIWWMEQKFKPGVKGDTSYKKWFEEYYSEILITPASDSERRAIVDSAYEIAPRLVEAWRSFREDSNDQRLAIEQITAPILFTWAKKDNIIRLSRNQDAVKKAKNAELLEFDAGHAAFLERPEEFNAAVKKFFHRIHFE